MILLPQCRAENTVGRGSNSELMGGSNKGRLPLEPVAERSQDSVGQPSETVGHVSNSVGI
jgi:hypothetical protein